MTVFVTPSMPMVETTRPIESHRLMFELHTDLQQIILEAYRSAADALTPPQILNFTPGAVDANGYSLDALRAIRLAYRKIDASGGRADLLGPEMEAFFAAVKTLGLYGAKSQDADAEANRIKTNTKPGR